MATLRRFMSSYGTVSSRRHVCVLQRQIRRSLITATKIEFKEFGDPAKVLYSRAFEHESNIAPNQVLLKVLGSPINPADIFLVQGIYGVKPPLPAVPGIEGVAKVLEVGTNVKGLKTGDTVIPVNHKWGTWTTHQVCEASDLEKIPDDIPWIDAAAILVNPTTAYRMLTDFVPLNAGDVVIQNGANSSVGQAVIQFARDMGCRTVNVVRTHPDIVARKEALLALGADHVLTEEELRAPVTKELFRNVPLPKLALNCVGGRSAADILRWLADQGVMVTYGGMSGQPLTLPVGPLIFKDISFHGFWCHRFLQLPANRPTFEDMMSSVYQMIREKKFKSPPHEAVPFADFKTAIDLARKPYAGKKHILVMQ